MGKGRPGGVVAPPNLELQILDDELAVFSWTDEPAPEAALTEAEQDILRRVATGASNAAIARARGSSVHTVANQIALLRRKLGAATRYELIRRYGRDVGAKS